MIDYQKSADNARASGKIALALRIELEIKICRQFFEAAAADPNVRRFEINGANISKTNIELALSTLTESDEGEVILHYKGAEPVQAQKTTYFSFVFGNDGFDVIHDYGGINSKELYAAAMKGIET